MTVLEQFEQLCADSAERWVLMAQRYVHNREDAEDAVQEVMIKGFRKLHQFRGDSKLSTWMMRIVINECLQSGRRRPHAAVSLEDEIAECPVSDRLISGLPDPERACITSQMWRTVELATNHMGRKRRNCFVLTDVYGCSAKEVADATGLNVPAVKSNIMRARMMLREALS